MGKYSLTVLSVESDNEHSGSSRGLQDTWRCNGESTVNVYYAVMNYGNIPGDVMVKVLSKSTFPHTPGRQSARLCKQIKC